MNNLNNRVNLIGNLGTDPDVKELESGKKLAKFSLATTERYKNKEGEKVSDTQWHNLVLWGPRVDFAEKYLKKGQSVAVEGRLNHRSYDDKDGITRYFTEIIVNDIFMLGTGKVSEAGPEPAGVTKKATSSSAGKTKK